jgi:hypothetical protein
MQDETIPDLGRVLDETQQCVLCVLLAPVGSGLCSMGELALACGGYDAVTFAVEELRGAGLVHRLGEFVFASRATARCHELDMLAVRPRLTVVE